MKKIGIVAHFPTQNTVGITRAYIDFFSTFGEVILLTPWDNTVRDLDLLVLPGGPDVNPFRYLTEEDDLDLRVGSPCVVREFFDKKFLPQYIAKNTPIFGIN